MNRKRMLCFLLGGLLLGPGVAVSRAGPITWEFSGEIFLVSDGNDLLGGAVVVGTPFSGSFTFESTTEDSDPRSFVGFYEDVLLDLQGQVGDVPFSGPLGETSITIVESLSDSYSLVTDVDFLGERLDFGIFLSGPSALFADTSLALLPPDLDSFGSQGSFTIVDGTEVLSLNVRGSVSVLVPEPATVLLLAGGLALAVVKRRPR